MNATLEYAQDHIGYPVIEVDEIDRRFSRYYIIYYVDDEGAALINDNSEFVFIDKEEFEEKFEKVVQDE